MREIEIWKPIKEVNNGYYISSFGRVKHNEKILSQRKNNKGYYLVDLYANKKRYQLLVHRLVASAFILNTNNYPCVNHKDENKQNNCVDNLEWCSHKYNMEYSGVIEKANKSTSKKVVQIDRYTNENIKIFKSTMDAQRQLGITNSNINECANGKRKTAGGFKWQFVK